MAQYTTSDLLNSVRQRGSIPTSSNSNNVNNTTNLLALATEELHIRLLPLIMSVRAEFYVTHYDYSITQDQASYAIPSRASGLVLRDVQIIEGTSIRSLPEIAREDVATTASGTPQGYYFQHQNVVLYPTPASTTNTLRMVYFARPSRLEATTSCAQISAIDTNTNTITVNSVPSTWAATDEVDLIASRTPYQCRGTDLTITAISGSDITLDSLPSDLAVNDWVALAEYTPIPQVPFEFQPVLAQMTTVKALEAIGDNDGVARASKDLMTIQANALALMTPRNHGEPKRVAPTRWR